MAERQNTWGRAEKLKSRKRIDRVFREGKSFSVFPYKVVYLVSPTTPPAMPPITPNPSTALESSPEASHAGPVPPASVPVPDAPSAASASSSSSIGPGTPPSTSPTPSEASPVAFAAPVSLPTPPEPGSAASAGPLVPRQKPPRPAHSPLQAGFGASTRNFKKAVDRNRIKRLSREAYRLQKASLLGQLTQKGLSMAVFFVFIGKELPEYATVSAKIGVALQKLLKETA